MQSRTTAVQKIDESPLLNQHTGSFQTTPITSRKYLDTKKGRIRGPFSGCAMARNRNLRNDIHPATRSAKQDGYCMLSGR
jgi:hypothetical protein